MLIPISACGRHNNGNCWDAAWFFTTTERRQLDSPLLQCFAGSPSKEHQIMLDKELSIRQTWHYSRKYICVCKCGAIECSIYWILWDCISHSVMLWLVTSLECITHTSCWVRVMNTLQMLPLYEHYECLLRSRVRYLHDAQFTQLFKRVGLPGFFFSSRYTTSAQCWTKDLDQGWTLPGLHGYRVVVWWGRLARVSLSVRPHIRMLSVHPRWIPIFA